MDNQTKLTDKQKTILGQITESCWDLVYPSARSADPDEDERKRQNHFNELLEQAKIAQLPLLAITQDIEVSTSVIRNVSGHDILIVLAHETGRDLTAITHWLGAGQDMPNHSKFRPEFRVFILCPKGPWTPNEVQDHSPTKRSSGSGPRR